jgi:hypothetical protein
MSSLVDQLRDLFVRLPFCAGDFLPALVVLRPHVAFGTLSVPLLLATLAMMRV